MNMYKPISDDLIRQIQSRAIKEPNILSVYLFGSLPKGYAGRESDLDLAVVVGDRRIINTDDIFDVFLPITFPKEADISVVDKQSSPLLLYEIVSGGKRIYTKSMDLANTFEAYALDTYYDTHHLRNIYRMYLKESLEKGTYGYKA